jgi:carbonic anhydrase/acetyltransferase-like protein (isoleucine patch superfamily)
MIIKHKNIAPRLAESAYIAPGACVIGDVHIGVDSSLWFNVVVRGDVNFIRIGDRTNIQDGSVIHVTRDTHPTVIGDDVTVGHSVTLHGCTVEDGCLIGIGAIVLDGATIGAASLVGAGSVVAPGTRVPPRSLVLGSPAKVKRALTEEECSNLLSFAENYLSYQKDYKSNVERIG